MGIVEIPQIRLSINSCGQDTLYYLIQPYLSDPPSLTGYRKSLWQKEVTETSSIHIDIYSR